MSHITHLYHLSALDFINTSVFPGMAPWTPSYTASDMLDGNVAPGSTLVVHYVQALAARRKLHTAGALFSGRQPIQNAMVPGGVTTLFSSTWPASPQSGTDYDMYGPFNAADIQSKFATLLNDVRDFVDLTYIPDVLTVASVFGTAHPLNFWTQGTGCNRFLSYGDYPLDNAGTLAIKRGIVDVGLGLTMQPFDQANIKEYVGASYYTYGVIDPAGLHPFEGKTNPNMKPGGYSWLKAPRYMTGGGTTAHVCEVGPLARMLVSYVGNDNSITVTSKNAVLTITAGGSYSVPGLVGAAATAVGGATMLLGTLGRHAARALEAKFLCDAVFAWSAGLSANAQNYTYKRIPKQPSTGYGLTEAPRGALGHWIKIDGRKVSKYQCVVPSTWNFSPNSGLPGDLGGAVEQALVGSTIGTTTTEKIVNILRIVHPFDCCIACAVHVVTPEGKETLKFAIGPDGRPTNIEVKE
jgi:hydrogenase large subunit